MSMPLAKAKKKAGTKKSSEPAWVPISSRLSKVESYISRGQIIELDSNTVMVLGTPTSKQAGDWYGRWCEFIIDLQRMRMKRLTTTGDQPTGRRGHSCIKIDDVIYLIGGWDSKSQFNDMYTLDLSTMKWASHGATMLSHRSGHAVARVQDGFVIHGGAACVGGRYEFADDLFYYSTVTHQMIGIPGTGRFPPGRAQHGMVFNEKTSELFIFGGLCQSEQTAENVIGNADVRRNDVWVTTLTYDTGSYYAEGWRKLPPMPFRSFFTMAKNFRSPQSCRGVFVRGNCVYVYGGEKNAAERPNFICQFNMDRKKWRKMPPQQNPPEHQAISGLVCGDLAVLASWSYVTAAPNGFWVAPTDKIFGPAKWTQRKHAWFPKNQRFAYRCLLYYLLSSENFFPGDDICHVIAKYFMDSEYF